MAHYTFLLLVAASLVNVALSMKYCKVNDDCDDLGSLECIKSGCEWGMCACPRGYVSRFMGSVKKFTCVPQNRIGQKCSTDGADGVCGPANSFCNTKTKLCECDDTYTSRFNGEMCLAEGDVYPSEMRSGDASTCRSSSLQQLSTYTPNSILDYNPQSCACPQGQRTTLWNYFDQPNQGKQVPFCSSLTIGDTCIQDADCGGISGAHCSGNKCACKTAGEVADFDGRTCGKPLTHGNNCTGSSAVGKVCDGSKGLTCGFDACYAGTFSGVFSTCVCHFTHTASGSTCTKRAIGDTCHGDMNCKGINVNAICVKGKCQNGSNYKVPSVSLILVCLAYLVTK